MNWITWIAIELVNMGMERWLAALLALLGTFAALVLLGVCVVAYKEGWRAHSHRHAPSPPRGATRHNPGQRGEGVAVVLRSKTKE